MTNSSNKTFTVFSRDVAQLLLIARERHHQASQLFLQQSTVSVAISFVSIAESFPEWVYKVGFNPGLREGFRFYLIQLDGVMEVIASMFALCLKQIDVELIQALKPYVVAVCQKNDALMQVLIRYFRSGELNAIDDDYTNDVVAMEDALKAMVPGSLATLELYPDYLVLTAFVYDMKDLRQLLLKLMSALPPLTNQPSFR